MTAISKTGQNLLFIAHRVPYPPNKGDKIRSFNEIKHLAEKGWRIHLCALADNPDDLNHWSKLKRYCESVFIEPISPFTQKIKSFKGFLNMRSLSSAYFYNRELQRRVDSILEKFPIKTILCFSGPMAEYVFKSSALKKMLNTGPQPLNGRSPRLVMDMVDVDSDKWKQYAKWVCWPMSWIYGIEGKLLAKYERRAADSFDATILVSSAEAEVFRKLAGIDGKIHSVANGVDLEFFKPPDEHRARSVREGVKLVFCGAMDYFPNIDAVCWFARKVLPLLRKDMEKVEFAIVGGNPSAEVLTLKSMEGVSVTGRVPDVRPFLYEADLSVSPMRIARGIQNKVLEAMAIGAPVVATPQAFEGIEAEPGKDLIVADAEPRVFAEAVLSLLNNPSLMSEMGRSARSCVETNYEWKTRLAQLDMLLV